MTPRCHGSTGYCRVAPEPPLSLHDAMPRSDSSPVNWRRRQARLIVPLPPGDPRPRVDEQTMEAIQFLQALLEGRSQAPEHATLAAAVAIYESDDRTRWLLEANVLA